MLAVADRHVSVLVCLILFEKDGVLTVFLFTKAYHILDDEHTVATVDHGEDATIKIWSARRPSSHPKISVSGTLRGGHLKC